MATTGAALGTGIGLGIATLTGLGLDLGGALAITGGFLSSSPPRPIHFAMVEPTRAMGFSDSAAGAGRELDDARLMTVDPSPAVSTGA
jgi:hypothetical protein